MVVSPATYQREELATYQRDEEIEEEFTSAVAMASGR